MTQTQDRTVTVYQLSYGTFVQPPSGTMQIVIALIIREIIL